MKYKIFSKNRSSHFIDVEITVENINTQQLEIQLPAWRPGRYELQNFAKNIQNFKVYNLENQEVKSIKTSKDRWLVDTQNLSSITIRYNYFANIINAGSSYIDEQYFYINPVNLCVYIDGRLDEPCEMELFKAPDEKIACGLKYVEDIHTGNIILQAADFYELADSPLLMSKTLQVRSYQLANAEFFVWFEGNIKPDWEKILPDFQKFTEAQVNIFGEFPQPNFHFFTWILPIAYYHGVEHRHSTMMVLGPDDQSFDELYIDLLGLASHELFHAWNICRIRPKELLPYDFTKENYFSTCFVAEGVTTYYGDLLLHRAGVFTEQQYLHELETCYRRHFENADTAAQSLLESSFDLWLDGYTSSIPNRKVSVYHKGAIAAQILDLIIKENTNQQRSLDDVMLLLWQRFGKPFIGYSYEDYQQIAEEVADVNLREYFAECIEGTSSLLETLNRYLVSQNKHLQQNIDRTFVLKSIDFK